MPGPDSAFSVEPDEFKTMVKGYPPGREIVGTHFLRANRKEGEEPALSPVALRGRGHQERRVVYRQQRPLHPSGPWVAHAVSRASPRKNSRIAYRTRHATNLGASFFKLTETIGIIDYEMASMANAFYSLGCVNRRCRGTGGAPHRESYHSPGRRCSRSKRLARKSSSNESE